jgi:hypothetical protein
MKTAILINGVYRPEYVKIHFVLNQILEKFPDIDVYFHTWDEHKHLVPRYLNVKSCPEPIIDYDAMVDPDVDISNERYNHWRQQIKYYEDGYRKDDGSGKVNISTRRLKNFAKYRYSGTKQILGYADLYEKVRKLNKGYDRFIRTRWDVCIQESADFTTFLRRCEMGPIGFAVPANRSYPHFFKSLRDLTKDKHFHEFFVDQLIIHHEDHFDPQLVYRLHKDKQLLPVEWGWYQVMIKAYKNNPKMYFGGAGIFQNLGQREFIKMQRKGHENRNID